LETVAAPGFAVLPWAVATDSSCATARIEVVVRILTFARELLAM